ncbi:helix-turn-helix domain-containing protein [Agilicoccus flavus]|uniref:helix-turn-helix domain-containing protein n=1 Tax=Agilicoccus flavus TaxID=2775968 RepID=UPI001CF6A367|nr:XRE family transcriptional regulator [Agilicoccus flavus]
MAGDERPDELTDEGALTARFLARIGERVRELRTEKALTVQQLADRAGVSRRLLTQIEHGQANPSLVTVTRLARALGTEFTALLDDAAPAAPITVRGPDEHVLVWSSDAGSTAHLLASTSRDRSADLWRWRLAPGDRYQGHADPARSQELFHVLSGTLTLNADEQWAEVGAGESARLDSDRRYSYANEGDEECVFVRVVSLTS